MAQVQAPETLLIADIDHRAFVCLRFFKTINGGEHSPEPFVVQSYFNGDWTVSSKHKTLGDAIMSYDKLCVEYERPDSVRKTPEFTSKWNTFFLEEPEHNYVSFSRDLPDTVKDVA